MTITNLKQVEEHLPNLGYAPSFEKNLRASIRKSAKVYNTELKNIPADFAAFDRAWGRGRVRNVPTPFRTADEFRTWRKHNRMVLRRLFGTSVAVALDAEWSALLAFVKKNQGKGRLLGANSHFTFGMFARTASAAGVRPAEITDAWAQGVSVALEADKRKSFRRGIERFNAMIAQRACLPELEHLLPVNAVARPGALKPPGSRWLRSAGHPGGHLIWAEFDEIIALKQHGEDAPLVGAPVQFKPNSAKAYEESLNWLLGGLAAEDLIDDGADLAETITHANLVKATNHWINARQARGQSIKTSTLHNHVSRLVHLAVTYLEVSPNEADRLRKLRKKPTFRTTSVGRMSKARETWIEEFDLDPAKQERAHRLPEELMSRAERVFAKERSGRKLRPSERMDALRAGVAATIAAILFRASPVRSANLRTLRMRGKGAEFDLSAFERDTRLAELRLSIPGEQVKNQAHIDEIADDELAPVIAWYLREIRPRLISAHPFNKPYADSDYLFPSTTDRPMERSNFTAMFRRACLEVNFDMTMHQARHICAYWILSMDPNAWDEAAALLGDDELTVRKYYGWMSKRRASQAGRAKLQQARKGLRKHRSGAFDDAS